MDTILQYITENKLDVLGTLLGFLYLILEFRTSIWMWVVGCIMPAIYIVVLYQKGIYADCLMEVYYFLAGVYGLVYWLAGKDKDGKNVSICKTPRHLWSRLSLVFIIIFAGIGSFLREFTDSTIPWQDAFTTSLSVIGMWMLSRKYIEQWGVWFVVDLASTALYIYKDVYGRAVLYGIYTAMAVYGYFIWRKHDRENLNLNPNLNLEP